MKLTIFISILILSSVFILSGCDSPTDSKATPVTSPALVAPPDQDSNITLTPTLQWSGAGDKLEISINEGFSSPFYSVSVTGNSHTVPSGKLNNDKWYWWHVGNSQSGTVYWSGTWSFRTKN
jgi:hypothetical protein